MRDDFYFGMTRREKVLIKVDILVCCWGHSSQTDWWILPDTPRADNVSDDMFLSSTKNSFCRHQHSPKLRPCTPKTSWPTREREASDAPPRWIPSRGIFANIVKKFPPWKSAFDQHAKNCPPWRIFFAHLALFWKLKWVAKFISRMPPFLHWKGKTWTKLEFMFSYHMWQEHGLREKKCFKVDLFWNWPMMMCRLRIQKLKIGLLGDFEKMRFLCFYIIGV